VKPGSLLRRLPGSAAAQIPVLFTVLFVFLAVTRPALLEDFVENPLVDFRFAVRAAVAPPAVPPGVCVVAVDEESIARYGRWPWTRVRVAELIGKVAAGKPRAIGVDIFFSEPEGEVPDARLAEALTAVRDRAAEALVFEVRRGGTFTGEVPDVLLDHAFTQIKQADDLRPLVVARAMLPQEPIASASVFGHVNYQPDRNGKLRWEYLYVRYGGKEGEYFPSLALQVARIARGIPLDKVRILGPQGVDFGGQELIPTDDNGRLLINYYGGERTFPHYPAGGFLSGQLSPELLRDKVVFIGATGVATYDLIVTPFAANMPGVEKNATVAANILAGDFLRDVPLVVDLLVVLLAGVAVFFLCRGRRASRSLVDFLLLAVLLVIANVAAFVSGWHASLAYPLLLVLLQGSATLAQQYLAEERRSREMRRMFSSYVTERVVNQLIAHPEMARLGGERREVSVLFSDIRGFTSISEKYSPEMVVAILNEYLGAMTEVVFHWEGTLDKFIGDAVMVFWGAPLAQADHAERAVRCALHMQARLAELNAKWAAEGKISIAIGIGVNTGEVLVGNIGAEGKKMEYTVIGDHVNLSSRIESLTKKYGSKVLISQNTLEKVRGSLDRSVIGHVKVRGVENVAVKGKEQGVRLYDVSPIAEGGKSIVEDTLGDEVVHLKEK
jgi:adenylate cyclase